MAVTGTEPISASNLKAALDGLLESQALTEKVSEIIVSIEAQKAYWYGTVTISQQYNGSYFWVESDASPDDARLIEVGGSAPPRSNHRATFGLMFFELEQGVQYRIAFTSSDALCGFTSSNPNGVSAVPNMQESLASGTNRMFTIGQSKYLVVYATWDEQERLTFRADLDIEKIG